MKPVEIEVSEAQSPLILGLPHTGTDVPDEIADGLNETGRALADTDWHIHELYQGLVEATTVRTPIHRYVIDVNRDPSGVSLYPGQNTTSLCPVTDFDGRGIYLEGCAPDTAEVDRRRMCYHAPYHAALATQMQRVKMQFGFAVLYDCHSIRGDIPFLFQGRLPDLNVGTNLGATCDPALEALVHDACTASPYSNTLNGRFKGGWTTRHYGRPDEGRHAIQMELAQSTYMIERAPWTLLPDRLRDLRAVLKPILEDLIRWRPA